MARIIPIRYKGRMWCVSVPSGAIVARRNGKVFVTGNSGFPKSMDIGKAIDKRLGMTREVIGQSTHGCGPNHVKMQNHGKGDTGIGFWDGSGKTFDITAPASDEAKKWNGYGTAIKPAYEPIIVARKPIEGTIVDTVLKWGTGALNIDGCRVATEVGADLNGGAYRCKDVHNRDDGWGFKRGGGGEYQQPQGRFPANLVHDGSEEVLACFPRTSAAGDSTARFFYCAKASRAERNAGLEGLSPKSNMRVNAPRSCEAEKTATAHANNHPTVKPLALMRWLITLVAPPNAVVLDPFMGSGTTGVAALQLGRRFVGIEREADYFAIASRRVLGGEPIEDAADTDTKSKTEDNKPKQGDLF